MAVITVTSLGDVTAEDGLTTLREAVDQAASGDTIVFDATLAGGRVELTQGRIGIEKDLTIDGDVLGADRRADITLDANGVDQIFAVRGVSSLTLNALVLTGGSVGGGGAVYIAGDASLIVDACTFTGNAAPSGPGGAIWNNGTLTITDSTFAYNNAFDQGGAVFSQGVMTATNTTFTNNTVFSGFPGKGGAISASGNASTQLTLIDCTVTDNVAAGAGSTGGGIFQQFGSMSLTNTIVSGNAADIGANVTGGFTDNGGNVIDGDPTLIFGANTLAYNGGPVATVALAESAGNPALDVGASALTDARGLPLYDVPGVGNDGSGFADAGAYEVQCFAGGTRISAPEGMVQVQDLRIGDMVDTAEGAPVPVLWIGRQSGPARALQAVRIAAGALGRGLPLRDLVVTGDHGMVLDGRLVNASALVDGAGIRWVPARALPARVTWYHVETETHAVILAEGSPAETFIDFRGRRAFDNFDEYLALYGAERIIPEMPLPRISARRLLARGA
ncbi:Hint domain-containing protein [Mameliella sp. CS4]|uniref:Hint domain-containing protein n=1 Tax=Mameliella sp. CS4 TaxID=2862329 RepID=UPI001C5E61D9|nr:Hint domain-containing protein [Mameliella sp. CS4]MBW4982243.1 Hint domain-containing protein [Mameliella sp. CS4]